MFLHLHPFPPSLRPAFVRRSTGRSISHENAPRTKLHVSFGVQLKVERYYGAAWKYVQLPLPHLAAIWPALSEIGILGNTFSPPPPPWPSFQLPRRKLCTRFPLTHTPAAFLIPVSALSSRGYFPLGTACNGGKKARNLFPSRDSGLINEIDQGTIVRDWHARGTGVIERRWEKFRGLSRVCRQISRAAYYQNGELTRFPTSAYAG